MRTNTEYEMDDDIKEKSMKNNSIDNTTSKETNTFIVDSIKHLISNCKEVTIVLNNEKEKKLVKIEG